MFVGAAGGGLWKTTDAGASWTAISAFLPSFVVTSVIFRPGDPSTMYAGTGEGFRAIDSIRGAGVLKSTDGGTSWSALGATNTSDFWFVNRLAMSADGATLLVATNTGLFRSTNQGASFTQVLAPAGVGFPEVMDVKFLPGSSTNAVAAGNSGNVYYSTNGGAGWSAATGPAIQTTTNEQPHRIELGIAPSSPSTVYIALNVNSGEVWRSTDSGQSYVKMGTPAQTGGHGDYALTIWVDPTNVSIVLVGGLDVFRSMNSGVTWEQIGSHVDAPFASLASAQHAIVADPGFNGSTNTRVLFGTDGGVWKTDNVYQARYQLACGSCFTINYASLNHGLAITQFNGGAGHAGTGKIVGGSQNNGTLVYTPAAGPNGWTIEFILDAGYAAIDPTDPNYLYGEFAYLRIQRSSNGGASGEFVSWSSAGGVCNPAPYRIDDACNGTANYVAPFMLDPTNPNRMLGGGVSLWQSNDIKTPVTNSTGPSWRAIKGPTAGSVPISALMISAVNPNIVWVGHNNGDVYVTGDSQAVSPTWTKVDGGVLPDRQVTSFAIDPTNTNVVYVTFDGFNADNIWKTTNSGGTWTPLSGLPAIPAYSVVMHPSLTRVLFVGTSAGVFQSNDAGASWVTQSIGPLAANARVMQLFWMGSTLVAATHGFGMFTLPASVSVTANTSTAMINGSVSVTAANAIGGPNDYVGLFPVGAPDSNDIARQNLGSALSATLSFTMPSISGNYEFRLIDAGSGTMTAKSGVVTVTCPTASPSSGWVCVSGTWKPRDRGDFSGDTRPDLIWQDPSSGAVLLWEMNGSTYVRSTMLNTGGTLWQIVGAGDFNLDGKPDLLWQHPSTGAVLLWQMDGSTYVGSTMLNSGGTYWKVVGVGDFNGDGKLDLLWQHPDTGAVLVWYMNGTTYTSSAILNAGSTYWKIVGTGDFTGDGKTDILWQLPSTGAVLLWQMDGSTYVSSIMVNSGGTYWQIVATGDYTGDGKPDIIWQHPSTGAVLLWQMDGPNYVTGAVINSGGTLWKVKAPR
jgi:hypothetical protein